MIVRRLALDEGAHHEGVVPGEAVLVAVVVADLPGDFDVMPDPTAITPSDLKTMVMQEDDDA